MTDPREEIKRLADEYYKSPTFELRDERRAALHAAIDAIPIIRQTWVTCVRCGLLVPESDLMGNLTDAALEGAPSGDYSANGEPLYHPPESKGESQ